MSFCVCSMMGAGVRYAFFTPRPVIPIEALKSPMPVLTAAGDAGRCESRLEGGTCLEGSSFEATAVTEILPTEVRLDADELQPSGVALRLARLARRL